MPQFILQTSPEDTAFAALSEVAQGFIEAMFFTEQCTASVILDFSGDTVESRYASDLEDRETAPTIENWNNPEIQQALREGTLDGYIPYDCDTSHVSAHALNKVSQMMDTFMERNADLANAAIEAYGADRLGNDLWYTFNGHGVGFSDRAELDIPWTDTQTLAEALTATINPHLNECYVSFDATENLIYID